MTSPLVWHWTRLKRQKNRWLFRLGLYRNPFADQVQPLDADVDMTDRTLLFIGGLHRSGTSVLHRILRSHPAATGIDNPRVPESEGQYVQDVFAPDRAFGGPGRGDQQQHQDQQQQLFHCSASHSCTSRVTGPGSKCQ